MALWILPLLALAAEDFSLWTYSQRLTLNTSSSGANVASPQSNFPMLVRLTSGHPAFEKARSDGGDIRFSDADGTALPYEVERWDPAQKKAEFWVKIPKVDGNSSTDSFTLHWGKTDARSLSDPMAVFEVVNIQLATYHLSDKGTGARLNSAWTRMAALPANYDGDESREGVIGRCDSLDGGSQGDYLDLGQAWYEDFSAGVSFSIWSFASGQPEWAHLLDLGNGGPEDNLVFMREADGAKASLQVYEGTGKEGNRVVSADGMEAGRWRHLAFTISGTSARLYVDGVQYQYSDLGTSLRKVVRSRNYIGRSNWPTNAYWKGKVDEISIGKGVRSADWIKLAYETQKPGSTALQAGPIVTRPLSILSQPGNANVLEGSDVTFSVMVQGGLPVSWQWRKNGENLSQAAAKGKTEITTGSAVISLAIPAAALADAGQYDCVLQDGLYAVQTLKAILRVQESYAFWPRTVKITFNTTSTGADVATNAIDFPVPVRIDASRFDFSQFSAGGADIRFSDPIGTPLSLQVAHWDATAKLGVVWVKIPKIEGNSATGFVVMHWGRAGVPAVSSGPDVFTAEQAHNGVWHFEETSGTVAEDAGAKLNPGLVAGPTMGNPGYLGLGYRWDGVSDRVELPGKLTAGLRGFTVSMWVKEIGPRACDHLMLCPSFFGGESPEMGTGDFWFGSSTGKLAYQTGLGGQVDVGAATTANLFDSLWHHVAASSDGADFRVYRDGQQVVSIPVAGLPLDAAAFDIGNIRWSDGTHVYGFHGDIDEVQFAAAAYSADRIRLAYATQREGGPALVYGITAKVNPPAPSFSPPAGTYAGPLTVTLAHPDPAAGLWYTLDGTFPDTAKTNTFPYSRPFVLERSDTVKAFAVKDGLVSGTASAAYLVRHTLAMRDSIRRGEDATLPDGSVLRYPVGNGTVTVTVMTDPAVGAVPAGFEAHGPIIAVAAVPAGSPFPGLEIAFAAGGTLHLYRLDPDGGVSWVQQGSGTLTISSAGTFFWGQDVATPAVRLAAAPGVSGDTLRVQVLPSDNVRNLLCRLDAWSPKPDSIPWTVCLAGEPKDFRLPLTVSGFAPLEIRLSVSDRSITGHLPDGESHTLTVARAFPGGPVPVSLAAGRKWSLAALPARPTGPVKLKDAAAANAAGAPLSAGIWQADKGTPGAGTYRMLGAEDTLPGGVGIWLASENGVPGLILPSLRSFASDSLGGFPIRLSRGWNLVANPALRALPWIVSRGDGEAYLRSDVKVLRPFIGEGYGESDTLLPWEGYFVYHHGGDTVISLHATPPALARRAPARGLAPPYAAPPGITLDLAAGGRALRLGAREWARDGFSVEDEPGPPAGGGAAAGPILLREGRTLESDFVRLRADGAMRWTLSAGAASGGGISVARLALPDGHEAWALLESGGVRHRLETSAAVPLAPGDTLAILAGTPAALAGIPELRAAREAPSRAELRLREGSGIPILEVALPGSARVTVRIWRANGTSAAAWVGKAMSPGRHSLTLGGWGRPRGMYWIEADAAGTGWRARRVIPWGSP